MRTQSGPLMDASSSMHPLAAQHFTALIEFRRWLDDSHLGEVLALYEPYGEEEREAVIRRDTAFLPEPLVSLTRYFVLGDALAEEQLDSHLPPAIRETIARVGLDFARHRLIRHSPPRRSRRRGRRARSGGSCGCPGARGAW